MCREHRPPRRHGQHRGGDQHGEAADKIDHQRKPGEKADRQPPAHVPAFFVERESEREDDQAAHQRMGEECGRPEEERRTDRDGEAAEERAPLAGPELHGHQEHQRRRDGRRQAHDDERRHLSVEYENPLVGAVSRNPHEVAGGLDDPDRRHGQQRQPRCLVGVVAAVHQRLIDRLFGMAIDAQRALFDDRQGQSHARDHLRTVGVRGVEQQADESQHSDHNGHSLVAHLVS